METLQFKTNINCGGCIAKATPVLAKEEKIKEWDVNTNTADKVLTVRTSLGANEIITVLQKVGFKAEKL
jgi:copper chaperone